MSKAWRHIELMPVFRCKLKSLMLQKGGGTPPHIHDHIAYRAPCATNQLGLRVRSSLIMHAPDRALVGGKRNILLHIVRQQATLAKFLPAHGTGEHSPFVPTRFQFDQPGIPKAGFVKDTPYLLPRPMALRNRQSERRRVGKEGVK